MWISEGDYSSTKGHGGSDICSAKPKTVVEDPSTSVVKIFCPSENSLPMESMIKCVDPSCQVQQHISCVVIPEKPMEGIPPVPPLYFCEICRIKRADLIVACEEQMLTNLFEHNLLAMGFEFVDNLSAALNNKIMSKYPTTESIMSRHSLMLKLGIQIIRDLPAVDDEGTNETEETSDDDNDENSEDGDDEDEQREGEGAQPSRTIPIYDNIDDILVHITNIDSYDCYSYDEFALRINHAWAIVNDTVPLSEVEVDIETAWPGRSLQYQYYDSDMDYFVILPPSRGPWGEWFIRHLCRIILSRY